MARGSIWGKYRVYARVSRNAAGYIPCYECGRVVSRNMTPFCRVPKRTY